ncbi:Xaa-Pro dipeptidase [Bienertia sinuspersici]
MATTAAIPRSSLSPPEIPMQLHVSNREKLVKSLQQNLANSGRPIQGFVLLQGGEEKNRYCTDHTELFRLSVARQESYFAYLFGVREPGFYGAIDVATGKSILFSPRLPAEYAVWMGEIKPLSSLTERYMVTMACYVDEMEGVLHNQYKGNDKHLLFLLHGLNTDSGNFSKPAEFEVQLHVPVVVIIIVIVVSICIRTMN